MNRDQLLILLRTNFPDIDVADKDHGWREDLIRIRFPKSDVLVSMIPEGISIECMCFFFGKEPKILQENQVIEYLKSISTHACSFWPG